MVLPNECSPCSFESDTIIMMIFMILFSPGTFDSFPGTIVGSVPVDTAIRPSDLSSMEQFLRKEGREKAARVLNEKGRGSWSRGWSSLPSYVRTAPGRAHASDYTLLCRFLADGLVNDPRLNWEVSTQSLNTAQNNIVDSQAGSCPLLRHHQTTWASKHPWEFHYRLPIPALNHLGSFSLLEPSVGSSHPEIMKDLAINYHLLTEWILLSIKSAIEFEPQNYLMRKAQFNQLPALSPLSSEPFMNECLLVHSSTDPVVLRPLLRAAWRRAQLIHSDTLPHNHDHNHQEDPLEYSFHPVLQKIPRCTPWFSSTSILIRRAWSFNFEYNGTSLEENRKRRNSCGKRNSEPDSGKVASTSSYTGLINRLEFNESIKITKRSLLLSTWKRRETGFNDQEESLSV